MEARLEASPKKSLRLLVLQCGLAEYIARIGTNFLKLQPYKATVVHSLLPIDCEARVRHCRWFQESVIIVLLDSERRFFSDDGWYILSGYLNSQNNRYWSTENPHALHEVSLHDLKVGFWAEISAWKTVQTASSHSQFQTLCLIDCHPSSVN
jgi:hypothetical protein